MRSPVSFDQIYRYTYVLRTCRIMMQLEREYMEFRWIIGRSFSSKMRYKNNNSIFEYVIDFYLLFYLYVLRKFR